jgi:hypothetical protein
MVIYDGFNVMLKLGFITLSNIVFDTPVFSTVIGIYFGTSVEVAIPKSNTYFIFGFVYVVGNTSKLAGTCIVDCVLVTNSSEIFVEGIVLIIYDVLPKLNPITLYTIVEFNLIEVFKAIGLYAGTIWKFSLVAVNNFFISFQ